jgi:hypothetical protein
LAEIKAALGDDPARFARSLARPIVVERMLRRRFENDDALHAPQRRQVEEVRAQLLAVAGRPVGDRIGMLESFAGSAGAASARVHDTTWRLAPRPDDEPRTRPVVPAEPTKNTSSAGPYTNESTARLAQPLDPPPAADRGPYFSDLPPELQNVLRVQLTKPGDVSAVIESPDGFQLFLCREKSGALLSAHCLTIPKRGYERWLETLAIHQ